MRRSRQGQSLAHNEGNTFFVKARYLRRNFSNFTCNSLLHCYCIWTKQDCRNQRNSDTDFTHFKFAGRGWTLVGHEVKCSAQQIIFLICFVHSIAFSQWKNSYFPLRPEPLAGYKLGRVALGTRMASILKVSNGFKLASLEVWRSFIYMLLDSITGHLKVVTNYYWTISL